MCSHFVLTLTVRHANRFNPRRDLSGLLALTARHLVWPPQVLSRVRAYLARRCQGHASWACHERLGDTAFLARRSCRRC